MDVSQALENARTALLAERNAAGVWEGELSTSALSTATAIVALGCVDQEKHAPFIERGCQWLVKNQNSDGGWGDTVRSKSNISTTLLAWSALSRFGARIQSSMFDVRCSTFNSGHWIRDYVGSLSPKAIAETVSARYGKDNTFSVPILMLCAICGRLGPNGWKLVPAMPFELSICPREWFAILKLPVVSYALPALIAIGYARHKNVFSPVTHLLRKWAWKKRSSALLTEIQPTGGGFLEAAPLTSFVTMALASAGQKDHPVVKKAVQFLTENVREDGSWPIDTNLATWATTLAVKALSPKSKMALQTRHSENTESGSAMTALESHVTDDATNQQGGKLACQRSEESATAESEDSPILNEQGTFDEPIGYDRKIVLEWILNQQYKTVHPFTNSPPGGWAWTDLPGGVPDADDTPGALLALKTLDPSRKTEAEAAVIWLLDLQNRDGGMPTFCRGWGALPFDRSSPDLTAHAIRAWLAWQDDMPPEIQNRIKVGIAGGRRFLINTQNRDGSWTPLWFGNQHLKRDEENPTYGTAMVLKALLVMGEVDMAFDAIHWLQDNQNPDGGWGGGSDTPSSIEETALAVGALSECRTLNIERRTSKSETSATQDFDLQCSNGVRWLIEATKNGNEFPASPIGFYFAKLWYFERLYPLVWTVEALGNIEH